MEKKKMKTEKNGKKRKEKKKPCHDRFVRTF